jgi:hypothetical protein
MLLYPTTRLPGEVNFPIRHRDTTQRIRDHIRAPRGPSALAGEYGDKYGEATGNVLDPGECEDIQSRLFLGSRVSIFMCKSHDRAPSTNITEERGRSTVHAMLAAASSSLFTLVDRGPSLSDGARAHAGPMVKGLIEFFEFFFAVFLEGK